MLADALPQLAAAFAVPLVLGILASRAGRGAPLASSGDGGRIGMGRGMLAAMAVIGVLFAGLGAAGIVWGMLDGDLALVLICPGFVLFGAFGLWGAHINAQPGWHVAWNADGVRGPSVIVSLRRRPSQVSLTWSDIVEAGAGAGNAHYVADADGTRVVWSPYYPGHRAFERALAARCPHLLRRRGGFGE